MGYLHIDNLYKDQTIMIFKECYALEKIHGTSAHIRWDSEEKAIGFFSGGEKHNNFVAIFDNHELEGKFSEAFPTTNAVIYGEAYGGKQQGMSDTYGKELKFIAFDVKVDKLWLDVENASRLCASFGIEFVDFVKVSTDIESINAERDRPSAQAVRNGCGDKPREGIVLRPLIEFTKNNGNRIIAKHKSDNFRETKTPRKVNPETMQVIANAKAIAEEWVTEMRLTHVLDKLPSDIGMENVKEVIQAMTEDVFREGKGEIVESREAAKFIGSKTAQMFKKRLESVLK